MAIETINKIEHKPLHCPLCGERFMNILGQPLPSHSQVKCMTSNNDEINIGICSSCIDKGISLDTCNAVLDGIKDYWIYEININKQMDEEEKQKRKDFHNSHVIVEIVKMINTGDRATKDANSKGLLE